MNSTPATDNPMPPRDDRWGRMKAVLGEAMEVDAGAREAFIEAACGDDPVLLAEVRSLLAVGTRSNDALSGDGPPPDVLVDVLLPPAVAIGATIGRYRIEQVLGSGGMGTVFEANDTTLNRKVALKVLSVGVASAGARRRFQSEATILARLDHPGIARVYETGVHLASDGSVSVPFFAMAYVDRAQTLDQFVRAKRPPLREFLEIFAHVCDAVHHGHQKGVLHRDIKPSNILIDASGQPRVIDFGVSRLVDASVGSLVTKAGDIVGTPAYMPPEAFEHGMQSLDTRADVYSLGVVLYEMLSGVNPFEVPGQTPLQTAAVVRAKSLPPLGVARSDCRGEVETIVAKAVARELSDRYQSAEQFASDLRRVLRYEPIVARPTPLLRQGVLFARRNRLLLVGVCGVTVAVAVGIAGLLAGLAHARMSEQRAVQQAARARQFSTFLTQMLRSSSPFRGEPWGTLALINPETSAAPPWPSTARPGVAPTVGDLLAAAMDHVELSFPDDPALQADVAATLTQNARPLSDSRGVRFAERSAFLLERAYGRDDVRSLAARQLLYHDALLAGAGDVLQMERDLAVIRKLTVPESESLLHSAWWNCLGGHKSRGTTDEFLPSMRGLRLDLENRSPADSGHKLTLDQHILLIETRNRDPAEAIAGLRGMLDRARALDDGEGAYTLGILFEIQQLQSGAGDYQGAIVTLERGAAICAAVHGGMDQRTYEWLSHLYFVALQLRDVPRAEAAAREQVRIAEAMLGPNSLYTTKANGRLARALLHQGVQLAEAEKAARKATEGTPELLSAGEGWAMYHEVLWAWSIRLRGDPHRAEGMLRSRMAVESAAGRPAGPDWVEIVRFTELAQCAMESGEKTGDTASRGPAIEELLRVAEAQVKTLGTDWPAVQLVEAARARWESLRPR